MASKIRKGLNVRCTFSAPETYVLPLRELLQEKAISSELIKSRVRDVLRVKFMVGLFDHPYQTDLAAADVEVNGVENQKVALQASREAIVLLKNEAQTLPLDASKIKKIAVIGPNADERSYALLHYGPLAVDVSSVLDGLRKNLKDKCTIGYQKGCELVDERWPLSEIIHEDLTAPEQEGIDKAVRLADSSDVAIVVLGGGARTCGENKSRSSLDLPGRQEDLLRAIYKTGKPVILVLINGRPLSINWADAHIPAIVEAWYPGAQGGQAIYEVLFGEYNPGGKLTVTFPKTVGQIPFNFPHKPASQVDGGLRPGVQGNQSRINGPLYVFGHGLSYTQFAYSNLSIEPKIITEKEPAYVSFDISNTGKRAGDEVVQLYVRDLVSSVTTYEKNLRGFERVHLNPGETKRVTMTILPEYLSLLDLNMKRVVEPGDFDILIGASSEDIRLKGLLNVTGIKNKQKKLSQTQSLPWSFTAGSEYTFALEPNTRLNHLDLIWRRGTKCEFEIQHTSGGGQFLTDYVGTVEANTTVSSCSFPVINASEMRIVIRSGAGGLETHSYPKLAE
jgi:beta-glucosidase